MGWGGGVLGLGFFLFVWVFLCWLVGFVLVFCFVGGGGRFEKIVFD